MRALLNTLRYVTRHPLNRRAKFASIRRYFAWQISSRLSPGPIAVPFVDSTRLLVGPGMTGATGNIYCGLHEFEEMAFVLHVLRHGDLFIDIGSNIGSYAVIAAGAAEATTIAIEPVPSTFAHLTDNIRLNGLDGLVTALNIGIGSKEASLKFTSTHDTVNHVVAAEEEANDVIQIMVRPLDAVLGGRAPSVIKIDVEGFETEVLNGAPAILADRRLFAVVMELNGSGARYGFDERKLHERMLDEGFLPTRYDPLNRLLTSLSGKNEASGNTLYVRDVPRVRQRLATARKFRVLAQLL